MDTDKWNPARYAQFKAERAQPFYDLLALVDAGRLPGGRAVDLGCGTGELTALLHETLQSAASGLVCTVGLDNSPAMLSRAAEYQSPGLSFEPGDIASFVAAHEGQGEFDLVFSNAALQWLPDHPSLIPRLLSCLSPGGQIAIQMPCNEHHPAYRLAGELAAQPPFADALAGFVRQSPVLAPEDYALLLARAGCVSQIVRLYVYLHRLPDRGALVEWVRGSMLTAYEKRLSAAGYEQFLSRYRDLLFEHIPDEQPCLFTFKRMLLWARLPG